jgi:hypothetical protein
MTFHDISRDAEAYRIQERGYDAPLADTLPWQRDQARSLCSRHDSSMETMSSPVDWRRAANKVSASPMRQCYMIVGKAKAQPVKRQPVLSKLILHLL